MTPQRRAMLAKIHIARKQLFANEDDYRAVILRVTGQTNASNCTAPQLDDVLREFGRLGFRPKPAARISKRPNIRMIYGVWNDLKPFVVAEDKEKALRAFVQRQTGKNAPEFLDGAQANQVIEGLKSWLARERRKQGAST